MIAVTLTGDVVTNAIIVAGPAQAASLGAEIPNTPGVGIGWIKNGDGTFSPPPPPPPPTPTCAEVDAERDRRVREGVTVSVTGYGPVALQGRDMDMRNLHGLATAAQLRLAAGAGATLTPFRDKANVIHQLSQPQIIDLWSKGAAFVSAVFQAAWALKDAPTIPPDFANDRHWP